MEVVVTLVESVEEKNRLASWRSRISIVLSIISQVPLEFRTKGLEGSREQRIEKDPVI